MIITGSLLVILHFVKIKKYYLIPHCHSMCSEWETHKSFCAVHCTHNVQYITIFGNPLQSNFEDKCLICSER